MTVYPRWRGEHIFRHLKLRNYFGLSPLARGTHIFNKVELILTRFIPAGAGNTLPEPSTLLPVPVYPRWRGEHGSAGRFI
ncbi:hypothetical protein SEEM010_11388 [Salmonella enterica subsp. enterica serovar Montevideo str. LQC 10]|nr:hypothetical protein SEEM010_11388 [Salmonella enterica subsp. enterica serovar Montevideo str. LQC 10]